MTFGQLGENNMRNIFLKKSCAKYWGVTDPFIKKNQNITLDQQSEMIYILFLFYVQVVEYQNILKLRC